MGRFVRGLVVPVLALAAVACSEPEPAVAPDTSDTAVEVGGAGSSTTGLVVGDGSVFCDAMIAIGKVTAGSTPAAVLTANEQLVAQLDEAQAAMPEEAPADLAALIDDYRLASEAIAAAQGDVEAAYAALPPDVVARLGADDSHKAAFDFLVARCGLTAP